MSWVVTALLSLVPANPILFLEMRRERESCLISRLVSQFLEVTLAMVNLPSADSVG